jgi:hypothetical protein
VRTLRFVLVLGVCLIAPAFISIASAQQTAPQGPRPRPERKTFSVTPAGSAIVIDGELNEPAWANATSIPLIYEWQPGDNVPAVVETICLVTFDSERLYVAFRAKDPNPRDIRAHFADRDVPFLDDTVGFMIDTFNDRRRGYQFRINPRGVQMDAINSDVDFSEDWSWDAIWDAEGRITADGYVVEIAIPFTSLRFPAGADVQTWGFSAMRDMPRSMRRRFRSTYTDRNQNCLVCQFDSLTGFQHITPGRNIEFDPTVTAARTDRLDAQPSSVHPDSLVTGDVDYEAGLSARWSITPNITFSGTVNPDFYQVEADAAQLDINTRFRLFFPEKRPFFLEGADFFSTPIDAVFTRSIVDPSWGAKLTGKQGRSAFGTFIARDEVTTMTFPGYEGSGFTSINAPLTSMVGRYRVDIAGTSALGLIVASRDGDEYANHVAGVDGSVRIGRSNSVRFQLLGSQTDYPDDVAADFDQQADAFGGYAYTVNFNRNTQNWFVGARAAGFSPDFRADSGFVTQTDMRGVGGNFGRVFNGGADKWYSRIEVGVGGDRSSDFSGEREQWGADLSFGYSGPLQSEIYYTAAPNHEYFIGHEFDNFRHNFGFSIRPTGDFAAGFNGTTGGAIDFSGARKAEQVRLSPFVSWNGFDRLALELNHTYQKLDVDPGRLFTANLTQGRAVYHFNRRTFVRAILQYTDVDRNALTNPGITNLETRRLFSQYLFSFKINPQTVLLAGYSDNQIGLPTAGLNTLPLRTDLSRTDRTFFLKLGYAWVM